MQELSTMIRPVKLKRRLEQMENIQEPRKIVQLETRLAQMKNMQELGMIVPVELLRRPESMERRQDYTQ